MDNEIARINKLTFGQLRNELANCNDPVRQYIIRNLMLVRYKQYLKNKELQHQMKKEYRKRQIKKIKSKIESKYKNSKSMEPFDDLDLFDEIDGNGNNDEIIHDLMQNNDELPENIQEYMRDKTNKNLRSRLHNDIDINRMKDNTIFNNKIKKNDFVPPFADGNDDQYASFEGAFRTSN